MSGVTPEWPALTTDVGRLQSAVRKQIADQTSRDSYTRSELGERVAKLSSQVETLAGRLEVHRRSADGLDSVHEQLAEHEQRLYDAQVEQETYVRAADVAKHVETCLADREPRAESEADANLLRGLALLQSRLDEMEKQFDALQNQMIERHEDLALRTEEQIAEVAHEAEVTRASAVEARQLVEKAVDKAETAAANNDALQADFDAAQADLTRRLAELDQRLRAIDANPSAVAPSDETRHTLAEGRLARLETFANEQGRYGASLSEAITAHLERIDARLRTLEVGRAGLDAPSPTNEQSVVIDLTDSKSGPPVGWQFERRRTRASSTES